MSTRVRKLVRISGVTLSAAALSLVVGLGAPSEARADEADAKRLVKAMFEYMSSQEAISFGFDSTLEVITTDDQRLELAGSGDVILNRPGKIRATRASGFADFEILFDGETVTLFNDNANLYSQVSVPGTVDKLIDVLGEEYDRPLPGADLMLSSAHDELMADVTDIKDLGSGVIDGVECDYFAFRADDVDWQIWIAQGAKPYPCRYVITSTDIPLSPEYSIQIRDWKTGSAVASDDFVFKNPTKAKKVDAKDLKGMSDMPDNFQVETGGAQ